MLSDDNCQAKVRNKTFSSFVYEHIKVTRNIGALSILQNKCHVFQVTIFARLKSEVGLVCEYLYENFHRLYSFENGELSL